MGRGFFSIVRIPLLDTYNGAGQQRVRLKWLDECHQTRSPHHRVRNAALSVTHQFDIGLIHVIQRNVIERGKVRRGQVGHSQKANKCRMKAISTNRKVAYH
jgi:hypothetical protein